MEFFIAVAIFIGFTGFTLLFSVAVESPEKVLAMVCLLIAGPFILASKAVEWIKEKLGYVW